jgi:hypothetical protein
MQFLKTGPVSYFGIPKKIIFVGKGPDNGENSTSKPKRTSLKQAGKQLLSLGKSAQAIPYITTNTSGFSNEPPKPEE